MASKKKDFSAGVSALDKFFTETDPQRKEVIKEVMGATQDAQEAPQKVRKIKDQKGSEEPQKLRKKVFSFRAEADEADSWRVWADASGLKVDELGERAIREYIKRHPLKGDQLQIYELKLGQKKES